MVDQTIMSLWHRGKATQLAEVRAEEEESSRGRAVVKKTFGNQRGRCSRSGGKGSDSKFRGRGAYGNRY